MFHSMVDCISMVVLGVAVGDAVTGASVGLWLGDADGELEGLVVGDSVIE